MAGSLRGRAAVSYAAGESQREFDSLTCHEDMSKSNPSNPNVPPVKRQSLTSLKKVSIRPKPVREEETGKCAVCGGTVVESFNSTEFTSRHSMTATGFHCENCGVKYEFIPPAKLRRIRRPE